MALDDLCQRTQPGLVSSELPMLTEEQGARELVLGLTRYRGGRVDQTSFSLRQLPRTSGQTGRRFR